MTHGQRHDLPRRQRPSPSPARERRPPCLRGLMWRNFSPSVGNGLPAITQARERRQLRIRAGHIRGFRVEDGMIDVIYRPRGVEFTATLLVARVINCAGPGADYDRIADPLVRRLLHEGTARPDALRLGLDVTGTCALRLGTGAISRRIF